MGSYMCKICPKGRNKKHISSGEVYLVFGNGHKYIMPAMILHYILDHGWRPPQEFINDTLRSRLSRSKRDLQYVDRSARTFHEKFGLTQVGYLDTAVPEAEKGTVPPKFIAKLRRYLDPTRSIRGRKFLWSMYVFVSQL